MKENLKEGVQKESPPNERRVNELLKNKLILSELIMTRSIAASERRVNTEDRSGRKPEFRFVAEFQTALYSHERKTVYVDAWNISHSSIAEKENLQARDEWDCQVSETRHYTSADIFVLGAAKDIKVMIIDSLFDFGKEELSVIRKLGYSVLSPNGNWLFEESNKTGNEIINIPSSISTGLG